MLTKRSACWTVSSYCAFSQGIIECLTMLRVAPQACIIINYILFKAIILIIIKIKTRN